MELTVRQQKVHHWNMEWNHSVTGLCKRIWLRNVRSSKTRGHDLPTYTQEELETWITSQDSFMDMYLTWCDSGYDKDLTPSVDRLRNNEGYNFANIQLLTFRENYLLSHQGFRDKSIPNSGLLNGGHKAVTKLSLKGEPICSYISVAEAARACKAKSHRPISRACSNLRHYDGFMWIYANDFDKHMLNIGELSRRVCTEYISQYTTIEQRSEVGALIGTFPSLAQASRSLGTSVATVKRIIEGKPTRLNQQYTLHLKEPQIE